MTVSVKAYEIITDTLKYNILFYIILKILMYFHISGYDSGSVLIMNVNYGVLKQINK